MLFTVSHAAPHAPQSVVVVVAVSHPSVSGAVVLQSLNPVLHPVYLHVVPSQLGPIDCSVSHLFPQPAQFVIVFVGVSQPFKSCGSTAGLSQSAKPGLHV